MYYGGIDAHRTYLTVAITDKEGTLLEEHGRVPIGDGEPILEVLDEFRPLEVAVETCPFWPWIYDVLEPTDIGFHLAHASELEAIANAETKTDSVDARLLARMLAANLIPEVYPKPASQREIVQLVRHRAALVTERTRLACRIHSHLHQQGLHLKREKLLGQEGRRWLRQEAWPWLSVEQRALAETHLELIDTLDPQIKQLDQRIEARSLDHAGAVVLQTIPGIGPYRSLLLVGEILPISRFPSPNHLVSYAGLAPRTRSSGGKTRYGSTPQGANRWVRGALVSAIPSHMRSTPDSSLGTYYERQKERIGWQKARVASARKLCRVIYAMLSTGEVWRG
ncbi:MAG: IS110 family transposase [Gemmatimonadota bacterium]|jgi:transposase